MPQTSFPVTFPLSPSLLKTNPILNFYSLYTTTFPRTPQQWLTVPSTAWYSPTCKTVLVDGTIIPTGQESWEYFRGLYARFPRVEREVLSFIVVEDEDKGEWRLHAEFLTRVFVGDEDDKGKVVEVPQSFVYTVGEAEEGKGTGGLWFRGLRCYYDLRSLEGALVSL